MVWLRCKIDISKDKKTDKRKIVLAPHGDPVELATRLEVIENLSKADPDNMWVQFRGSL